MESNVARSRCDVVKMGAPELYLLLSLTYTCELMGSRGIKSCGNKDGPYYLHEADLSCRVRYLTFLEHLTLELCDKSHLPSIVEPY